MSYPKISYNAVCGDSMVLSFPKVQHVRDVSVTVKHVRLIRHAIRV